MLKLISVFWETVTSWEDSGTRGVGLPEARLALNEVSPIQPLLALRQLRARGVLDDLGRGTFCGATARAVSRCPPARTGSHEWTFLGYAYFGFQKVFNFIKISKHVQVSLEIVKKLHVNTPVEY